MRTARSSTSYSSYSSTTGDTSTMRGSEDAEVDLRPPETDAAPVDLSTIPAAVRASIRVLVVDDDRSLREGCASVLQVDGYNVSSSGRGDEALDLVKRTRFDIVLVDLYMTPVTGMEILRAALATQRSTIVVVMTGNPSVSSSIEALREGAWDYLPKPFSGTHLQVLFGRAVHAVISARRAQDERQQMLTATGNSDRITLLGVSPAFRRAVDLARRVAATNASVMLVGESGTGKELIAQFLHQHSRRANKKLVPVNCAALPEPLLESEMFGHRKGSFTGADREKPGLLEMADGGTFFLDELTEMSLPLQAKLLRVLQDGVVRRVGSESHDAIVDVRFVAAMNRDPREAVRAKVLREDLYYRLNVVPITLPPLRNRIEDIPILAEHFLTHFWFRHHRSRDPVPHLSPAAISFLQACPWRGNVRELQNVIEHLAVLAEPGSEIDPQEIPVHNDSTEQGGEVTLNSVVMDDAYHLAKDKILAHFEKEYLNRLVARASGNMSRAARLASVDRTTLYRLLERHGLRRESLNGLAD